MLKKNDIIDIWIQDLTVEGSGIGRQEGLVVFVPKALPDEMVSVKIIKITKKYAVARLKKIHKLSKHRTAPFCAVFEQCGGCTLQHLAYPQQLAFKARHIKDCLQRLGGIEIDLPQVIAADNIRDYRNKASFPVAQIEGSVQAGFYAPRSHRLVVCDCPIQKQQINDIKNAVVEWANDHGISAYNEVENQGILRHIIGRQTSTGQTMAGVVVREQAMDDVLKSLLNDIPVNSIVENINSQKTNAILGQVSRVVAGDGFITEQYEDLFFRASLESFLQVNHEQSEKLYQTALDFADLSADDTVFDLFCGIGTISLLAAKRAKKVLGIEYVQSAAHNAVDNAKRNNIENAHFLAGDAGEMMDKGILQIGKPDSVILDPPRKGCDAALIDKIAMASPKRIVYVSCSPATLARDAAIFKEKGYMLQKAVGVDMFPHTTHVECCCQLIQQ